MVIEPDKLYTEEETRELLGGIGKTKLWEYRNANCIAPFRRRPTMYLGAEIQEALTKITNLNRTEPAPATESAYGL